MGNFSLWHWIVVLAIFTLYVWPISRVLKKMGYSPWWALLALITPLNLIGLWFLAYKRWPTVTRRP